MANDHGTKPDLKAVAVIGRRELVGRELAHVASLLLLKFSVKVVRHKELDFLLWRAVEKKSARDSTPGVRSRGGPWDPALEVREGKGASVVAVQGWASPQGQEGRLLPRLYFAYGPNCALVL